MLYLILVSLVWSFSFPLIKGALGGVDPVWVAFVRLGLSLLVFAPLLRVRTVDWRSAGALAGIGAVEFGLMYVLYIASYAYLPAHAIVLLTTTTPLFVTLASDVFARRMHAWLLVTALLAVAGGAVIQYPDQPLSASLIGVALVQGSNLAFACGQVAYCRLSERDPAWRDAPVFGYLYLGAVLVTGPWACARLAGTGAPHVSAHQIGTLIYLGVVASGVGFFLWNLGARRVTAGALAVMNNIKIPLGIVASLVLLHEHTDYARLAAGTALMGLALCVNARLRQPLRTRSCKCILSGVSEDVRHPGPANSGEPVR